jgi:hypothetical protein
MVRVCELQIPSLGASSSCFIITNEMESYSKWYIFLKLKGSMLSFGSFGGAEGEAFWRPAVEILAGADESVSSFKDGDFLGQLGLLGSLVAEADKLLQERGRIVVVVDAEALRVASGAADAAAILKLVRDREPLGVKLERGGGGGAKSSTMPCSL